jgi:predicted CXXCH cytochrome family protein
MPEPRRRNLTLTAITTACLAAAALGWANTRSAIPRHVLAAAEGEAAGRQSSAEVDRHRQEVMKSSYCADCHPAIYAEHEKNTHGRAFTDPEVRLATGRFSQGDCIICHTPRPIFETGNGLNPVRRHHGLEEGNTCMTCHWKPDFEYGHFNGGVECRQAFDPRVGEVEACASCHRNHGTPYQWALAPTGQAKGMLCMDCHMPTVERPVAVGEEPRLVRSHSFPASRSESQLRKAYAYEASIDADHVLVRIRNRGAGHNFPTELKQRSVESLVIVRDAAGQEISRSRKVFRDPYKRPYGLTLPVNTQIPAGKEREHRVPIRVQSGSVECQLFYKRYFPIEDSHPDLARRLEVRHMAFSGVTPSDQPVEAEQDVVVVTPENIAPELAGPANLVDFARPPIGETEVVVPEGDSPEVIARLIELFQFPVPQANGAARKRLIEIGSPAVPALIAALGSWDNKTWNQSAAVLRAIGQPAIPALLDALEHQELYVRIHACDLLAEMEPGEELGARATESLLAGLGRSNALDRARAAHAVGVLGLRSLTGDLLKLLGDQDPDVVREAALALADWNERQAIEPLRAALERFIWPETRRDIAGALAALGDPTGIPVLLSGLLEKDDLTRESMFETLFAVTGRHFGFEPLSPYDERLESISRWQEFWASEGGPDKLRRPPVIDSARARRADHAVGLIGGTDGTVAAGDDDELRAELIELGEDAVPALALVGLKYAPGFAAKRALTCDVLAEIGSREAVPALITALRDPVVSVAAWACYALGRIGDPSALPAVLRHDQRLRSLAARGALPPETGSIDVLLAQSAATRSALGDQHAMDDLVGLLLSPDSQARHTANDALRKQMGSIFRFDADAPAEERRAAIEEWFGGS